MKILLVGGGSGGPVAPLLAVAEQIKKTHPKAEFLLVGTKSGPEARMAKNAGIDFRAISAGKWRRYFSFKNFGAPFFTLAGFYQAVKILNVFKPDCIFGTGSFVQVPAVWAGKFKGIPVVIHQQDVMPNLANKLCSVAASRITVTFDISLKSFSSNAGIFYKKTRIDKVVLTGNPIRPELKAASKEDGIKFFNLKTDLPTLLVLGGGTGAEFLNKFISGCLPELSKVVQIIHAAGKGKLKQGTEVENYHSYEFIDNMAAAYAAADIVFSRAGLSTISELSNLQKFSIIVPLPDSPQELNAFYLLQKDAAIVLSQNHVSSKAFPTFIRKLLFEPKLQERMKNNIGEIMPRQADKKISDIIIKLAERF